MLFDELSDKLNKTEIEVLPRDYMGLSGIGEKCHRKLQFDHYWLHKRKASKRMQRLWGFGHMMEQKFIDDLATEGIYVKDTQSEVIGFAGHWKGHCDGIALSESDPGVNFLVEFKTHAEKYFNQLTKDGVMKAFSYHYDQMIAYMGYLELPFGLYMAYNKNTSEYYFEIIMFDSERFKELKRKEQEIIVSDTLLPRIGNGSKAWFECKLCDAADHCYGDKEYEVTCRSCAYVDVLEGGKWKCTHHNKPGDLNSDTQKDACPYYELGDMFQNET